MSFVGSLFDAFANIMVSLGLGSPLSRALAFGSIGFTYQFAFRPSISYANVKTKTGQKSVAKQFSLLATKDSGPTTYFPWFAWPLSFAVVGGLFL